MSSALCFEGSQEKLLCSVQALPFPAKGCFSHPLSWLRLCLCFTWLFAPCSGGSCAGEPPQNPLIPTSPITDPYSREGPLPSRDRVIPQSLSQLDLPLPAFGSVSLQVLSTEPPCPPLTPAPPSRAGAL